MSPVMTAFELKPIRVRNIFICSDVVFCASSRMMKASFNVRPRMKAMGAISITFFLEIAVDLLRFQHVVERVIEWAQVGIDLLLQRAGKKAQSLSGFYCGTRQHNTVHAFAHQRRDGHCHREVGLARTCGADAKYHVVLLDG